jgi:hypothetical protein
MKIKIKHALHNQSREEDSMGKLIVSTALWVVFTWMLAMPVVAEVAKHPPNLIAQLNVGPSRVDWRPTIQVERWMLTIAGPGDFFSQRTFEAGQGPFLSLFDPEGNRLPDGSYKWELREIEIPTRPAARAHTKAEQQRRVSAVTSGNLFIKNGGFVEMPAVPSQPPLPAGMTKDLVNSGNLVVQGNACIGNACLSNDASVSALKLKSSLPNIVFDGIEIPEGGGGSDQDWALLINSSSVPQFSIADFTNALVPFSIEAGAPSDSLYIAGNGRLGLGTSTPATRLDIKSNAAGQVVERVQNLSATGYSGIQYFDHTGTVGLFLGLDNTNTTTRFNSVNNYPLLILTNTTERMRFTSTGNIGIGTATPSTKLHIAGSAGNNKMLIEETSGTTVGRELLELKNNGGPVVILDDTSVLQRWAMGTTGANFALDEQTHAGTELFLTNAGNLTVSGVITQNSSRSLKTGFVFLDPKDTLARVSTLPVSLWSYKSEAGVRHIGPMAEDFYQTFQLGADDKHIAPGDQAGVALLALQGLNQVVEEKQREIVELRSRIEALEKLVQSLAQEKVTPEP